MATEIEPLRAAVTRAGGSGLSRQGLSPRGEVHRNLAAPEISKAAVRRDEGKFADMGSFVD
ncbi:MAG: phosphoenolpyruvate carboxykinase (ATP), partial [Gemmatimonadaceae bacterium]